MKYRYEIAILLFLCVSISMLVGACAPVTTKQEIDIPTPVRLANRTNSLDVQYQISPIPLTPTELTRIDLNLKGQNLSTCLGIPGKSNVFLIVQPSEGQTALWERGKKLLGNFVDQADQDQDILFGLIDKTAPDYFLGSLDDIQPKISTSVLPDNSDLVVSIQSAVENWQQQVRPGATPAIILFIHHELEPSAGLNSALSLARQAGFLFHVIAYQAGTNPDQEPSLENFGGSIQPDEFTINPDATALRKIFIDVTSGSRDLIAQDIKLTVLWSPVDLFKPAFEKSQDLTTVNGNILWTPPFLKQNQDLGINFQGQVDTGADLTKASFNLGLVYTDCNGFKQEQVAHLDLSNELASIIPTPVIPPQGLKPNQSTGDNPPVVDTGPDKPLPPTGTGGLATWLANIPILLGPILPYVGWILLAALILFLLYMLIKAMKNFFRKPEPKIPLQPSLPPHLSFYDTVPAWLKALRSEPISDGTIAFGDGNELQETILIGLGPIGREVLSAVSLTLTGRYGNSWRQKVRLAYIDAVFSKTGQFQVPYGMDESQCVFLQPDLVDIKRSINSSPQDWKQWDWYDPNISRLGRADGRMALFYDLKDGISQSKFYTIIEKATIDITNPAVRVVGSTFDDVGSSMLVDVARLVQIIMQKEADVHFWLMGPTNKDWIDRAGAKLSTDEQNTRTLATLRELERFQRNTPYHFAYVGENNLNDRLRKTYNYAVVQTVFLFDPLNTSSTKEDAVDVMVDGLLATLSPSVTLALNKHLLENRSRISDVVQHRGKGVMCGIGTFSVKTTNDLIEDAMAWRMVRDLLFGEEYGLYPRERCGDTQTGAYEELQSFSSPPLTPDIKDEIYDVLFSLQAHREWDQFLTYVTAKLNEILNGGASERSFDIRDRRRSIDLALKWVRYLNDEAKSFPDWELNRRLASLQIQLTDLKNWFDGELYNASKSALSEAQQRLMRLLSQKRRESSVPSDLEWTEYKTYIRQSAAESRGSDQLPVMGKRFGWHVSYDEIGKQWVLRFVLPPRNFAWAAGLDLSSYIIPLGTHQMLESLHLLALTYTKLGKNLPVVELAKRRVSASWIDNAEPMLGYSEADVIKIAGGRNTLNILAAPRITAAQAVDDLHKRLSEVAKEKVELCETKDDTMLTILRVVDWIPFDATTIYEPDKWLRRRPDPSHYVWKAEQIVAGFEQEERLSAQLVGLLGEDEELLNALALCLIYKLVKRTDDGWVLPGLADPVLGDSWAEMINNFFVQQVRANNFRVRRDPLLKTWKEQIAQQRRKRAEQKYSYLKEFVQEQLEPQIQSQNAAVRDLARYLKTIVEQEKQMRTGA